MNLHDVFFVRKDNVVGIRPCYSGYRSASMGCVLAGIEIDEKGRLFVEHDGRGSAGPSQDVKLIKAGRYCATELELHGKDNCGVWMEYHLVVIDNQVLRVKLYGELLYLADGYPMLDEFLNPVPPGYQLDIEVTTGVYPDAGKRSHRFFHSKIQPKESPSPIFQEGSAYDLEHMYPGLMKVLGVDPHPTTPKVGVISFSDGKPVSYEAIETPGYLTIPKPSLDALGRHIDSRKFSRDRFIDDKPRPIYREIPGYENRLDVLAMLRRQRFNQTTSVESYALDKILRKNPHVMMVVFERRVEGNKRNRYSKCIQDIVLRNKP